MNLARSVAEVLAAHVSFEIECIDRMYCNVYQPRLQHVGGVVGYVRHHLGLPVPSTVPLGAISDRFIRQVHAFATTHQIPWVDFVKGQRKDDVMHAGVEAVDRVPMVRNLHEGDGCRQASPVPRNRLRSSACRGNV